MSESLHRHRSSETGEFVTEAAAEASPGTTTREKIEGPLPPLDDGEIAELVGFVNGLIARRG